MSTTLYYDEYYEDTCEMRGWVHAFSHDGWHLVNNDPDVGMDQNNSEALLNSFVAHTAPDGRARLPLHMCCRWLLVVVSILLVSTILFFLFPFGDSDTIAVFVFLCAASLCLLCFSVHAARRDAHGPFIPNA